ncbi:MAG: TRAP transporter small permease [Burkholderiaceae bacterium]|nr:TRAP transporter small permease [Burkholderiaceae bacterium]MDP3423630.1 TRAP transporter small permease [Burkholderiaceae bacterium]MDZ4162155.1 TRAP transporter small permease [Burkholderiales bacterium]
MADILVSETHRKYTGVGLWLDRACKLMAILAGLALLVLALLSLRSIVGRSLFDSALLGDYELVQIFSAVAVAMALPYANWIGGHVIVDFFTAKSPVKTNAVMDLIANLLMAFFAAILSWRLAVGMLDLKSNFDASMMLNIPTWWGYVPMVPSFALLSATALYAAVGNFRKLLP